MRTAIGWTAAGTVVIQACALAKLLTVAAVVPPQAMGIYAMAASLTAAAGMLGDSGLRQLYISRQADEMGLNAQVLLSNIWFGILCAQVIITLLTVPLALGTLAFVDLPDRQLLWMAVALAGCTALNAARNPAQLFHERLGNFAPSVKAESYGQISGLAAIIIFADLWPNIWLLIVGQAISAIVSAAASYLINTAMHSSAASFSILTRLARKGRPFLTISATTYITASLDKLLLGVMLSPSAAGVYFMAQRLSDAPRALYASAFGRTALPYYAWQKQHNGTGAVRQIVTRYTGITVIIFGAGAIFAFFAKFMLPEHMLEHEWGNTLPLIPILLIGVGMRAACHMITPSLIVVGRMDIEARMKVQEGLAYLILLPTSIWIWSMGGAAWAFVAIYSASMYRRYAAMQRSFPAGTHPLECKRPNA